MDFEMEDFAPVNDRVMEYKGFKLTHSDPHGHVTVSNPNGGRIPAELEGTWTDLNIIFKKIDNIVGRREQEKDKPAIDNNTRKVQEILKAAKDKAPVKTPSTAREAIDNAFTEATVVTKKYEGK